MYLVGIASAGFLALRLACDAPDIFAGAAGLIFVVHVLYSMSSFEIVAFRISKRAIQLSPHALLLAGYAAYPSSGVGTPPSAHPPRIIRPPVDRPQAS